MFKSPKLDKPWRDVPWGTKEDFDYVMGYKPHSIGQHVRILLHGPPGSGKSSFINSVDSALRGEIVSRALAARGFDQSFTTKLKTFKIQKKKSGSFYPFVFSDTMGIEKSSVRGADVENIKRILTGHLNDGFELGHGSSPTETDLNQTPPTNDRVHVVVCVVAADTTNMMDDGSLHNMKVIRREASALDIPQVVILTKIDEACPQVKKNIRNVYRSKFLKEQMDKVSVTLGIPLNCVFPVQNYSEETKTIEDIDALIMNAMRTIILYGGDFLYDTAAEDTTPLGGGQSVPQAGGGGTSTRSPTRQ